MSIAQCIQQEVLVKMTCRILGSSTAFWAGPVGFCHVLLSVCIANPDSLPCEGEAMAGPLPSNAVRCLWKSPVFGFKRRTH